MPDLHTIKRNVTIGERRTSILLEKVVWQSIDKILEEEKICLSFLCFEIDKRRKNLNFSQALRMFVVIYFRQMALSKLEDETVEESTIHTLAEEGEETPPRESLLINSLHHFVQVVEHAETLDQR